MTCNELKGASEELVISHERTRSSDFGYNAGFKLHSNINVFFKKCVTKSRLNYALESVSNVKVVSNDQFIYL